MKYNNMANRLYKANETEIYELTGCLSNCDKYEYDVKPMTDIVTTVYDTESIHANTMDLGFVFTNGRHELKEQVIPHDNLFFFPSVNDIIPSSTLFMTKMISSLTLEDS